jgi:hypothetical protein
MSNDVEGAVITTAPLQDNSSGALSRGSGFFGFLAYGF